MDDSMGVQMVVNLAPTLVQSKDEKLVDSMVVY
jgi:hypothetical protein